MGLTAENVLVRMAGAETLLTLADAIRRTIGPDFEELPAGSPADRTIVVWADPESAWTAVADTQFGEAKKFAAALSRETGAATVAVGVFDSDDAWLRLCRNGKAADILSLRGKTPRGRPERWAEELRPPATPQDFLEQLSGETLFVEQRVSRAAELLGATAAQCLSRADELDESSGPMLRLGFRSLLLPEKREAEGPPVLTLHDRLAGIEAGAGDSLQQLSMSVRNAGGASRGVEVRLEGDAIERGLLEEASVTVVRFLGPNETERVTPPFVEATARAEAAVVPAGPASMEPALLGKMLMADPSLFTKGRLWINFTMRAAKAGEGQLRVRVLPLANPEGQAVWEAPVRVSAALRKPLRSVETGSLYARKLATPATLVGLAVLDGQAATALPLAQEAIHRWIERLGAREGRWRLHWKMLQLDAPRDTLIAGSKPAGDKAWKKAMDKLEEHGSVWAALYPDKEEREAGMGFLFEGGTGTPGAAAMARAPHLGFWTDLRGLDPADQQRLRDGLIEIIDNTAEAAPLLQGFVARWENPEGLSADNTLYELSCGIVGQCVQGRQWCGRWLRAVSDTLWLGPSLREFLGDLDAVTEIEAVGSASRLMLRPELSLDQLEEALAAILPGVEDWQQGVQQLYARV